MFIDEWQLYPPVWDHVRRGVDDDGSGEQFLLAGSAEVTPGTRIHSDAGRMVSLVMRPLAFSERGLVQPTVSLRKLLRGEAPVIEGEPSSTLADYTDEILRSGFPGIRDLPDRARGAQLDSHLRRIVERELPDLPH
ncbi:AAA family ATPase [Agromyces larvae]|uniref:AAA family ATPase n=1 Tax=Agromyces larvae TaxID=2929802 RepID=A0ABY4BVU9_9MICO|nr:AAA family ATPase [Agromyces larvae]UOE42869.1 AAA family ATPase [Agromyces larvae]